jgi:hypothetical protein
MSYLPVIIGNGNHLAPVSSKTLLASLSENGQRFLALCSVDPKSMDCFDVAGHGQQWTFLESENLPFDFADDIWVCLDWSTQRSFPLNIPSDA